MPVRLNILHRTEIAEALFTSRDSGQAIINNPNQGRPHIKKKVLQTMRIRNGAHGKQNAN